MEPIIVGDFNTTPFAPTTNQGLNDFNLYGANTTTGIGGVVDYGNVVVPDEANWQRRSSASPGSR